MESHPNLEQAVAAYREAILAISSSEKSEGKSSEKQPSLQQTLGLLHARDRVETLLASDKENASVQLLSQLVELDLQLKRLSQNFEASSIKDCRESFNPAETSWWWFLTPSPFKAAKLPRWAELDWVWSSLTVVCLIISGTFMSNTLKAFSQNGLDLLQTLSTVAQGSGLVLVTGGALTDKGKQFINNSLTSVKIPPHYHAEVMCALSATVLAAAYGIHRSLPELGKYYYSRGQSFYDEGELTKAQDNFTEALGFAPNDFRISAALGNIDETLGNHDQAKSTYQVGVLGGHPESLSGMGRVLLRTASTQDEFVHAESIFRLALAQPSLNKAIQAELHSHLGLTLIKQAGAEGSSPEQVKALRQEADQVLRKGIEIDRTLAQDREPGLGLSYCYLAILLQQQKANAPEADQQWKSCITYALPTSIDQYRDILAHAEPNVVRQLDTSGILRESLRQQ